MEKKIFFDFTLLIFCPSYEIRVLPIKSLSLLNITTNIASKCTFFTLHVYFIRPKIKTFLHFFLCKKCYMIFDFCILLMPVFTRLPTGGLVF